MIFEQYVIVTAAFVCLVFSPMIAYFGVVARRFSRPQLLADVGVIFLAAMSLLLSAAQIVAALRKSLKQLVAMLYLTLLLSGFMTLVIIGVLMLRGQILNYYRQILGSENFDNVEKYVDSNILSMANFSLLTVCLNWVQIYFAAQWVGFSNILRTAVPSYLLIELVYSAFLVLTGLKVHFALELYLADQSPHVISILAISIGVFLFLSGVMGFIAHHLQMKRAQLVSLALITFFNLAFLILGFVLFFAEKPVANFLASNWVVVKQSAEVAGLQMTEAEYVNWGKINLKFCGLCYLSFFLVSLPLTVSAAYSLVGGERRDELQGAKESLQAK